jgi:HK97 family phage major capsid protein
MSQLTTNAASILRPESVNALIIEPLTQESVAFASSTVVNISTKDYRIPTLTGDPDTDWTPEGEEITPDEAAFDEINVTPSKVAGLTVISRELAADSTPEAEKVISQRLVQSLRRKVDTAWFANTTSNGPDGLGSISPQIVYGGTSFADTDPFIEAVAAAQTVGATLTSFVTSPATALSISVLKNGNDELILSEPAGPGLPRTVSGVPLVVSPDAPDDGSVWGISKARAFVIVRQDTEVAVDRSVFFTSDKIAVRVIARIGFGFPHEQALVKIVPQDPS